MTNLTPKMALKFIKDAKKLGVTKGKLGTLEFEIQTITRAPGPALKVTSAQIVELNKKRSIQDQYDHAKEELQTLHVQDPMAFEEAIANNELLGEMDEREDLIEETHGS